jgi:hypothetical protein
VKVTIRIVHKGVQKRREEGSKVVYRLRLADALTLASKRGLLIGVLGVWNGFKSIWRMGTENRVSLARLNASKEAKAARPRHTLTYASQTSRKNRRIPSSFLTSCSKMNLTERKERQSRMSFCSMEAGKKMKAYRMEPRRRRQSTRCTCRQP